MIEGKVAQVLNARELVINVGTRSGVRVGMTFAVLAETPLEIRDPDSGISLGEIDREKVRVRATEVRDSFTICKTFQTRAVGGRGVQWDVLAALAFTPSRNETITLRTADSALPPPLSEEESYVKVKDRVKQVEDEEATGGQ